MPQKEASVIRCPKCTTLLKVGLYPGKTLLVGCPKCKERFYFESSGQMAERKQIPKLFAFSFIALLFVLDAVIAAYVIPNTVRNAHNNHKKSLNQIEVDYRDDKEKLEAQYREKLVSTNVDRLREDARNNYLAIWRDRNNYDSRYAVSEREKAQLQMLALSQDRTKPVQETILALAGLAAPKNSEINVEFTERGLVLDIDFDMSELSPREKGIRTRHSSIESLKEEVEKLTYQVTNDVYQFSRDLDLASMQVGCRHFVRVQNPYAYGLIQEENTVIYKVKLDKSNIRELEHNPFLDTYSTKQYMTVLLDEFDSLRLTSV